MPDSPANPKITALGDLETKMQKVSLVVSLIGLGLMGVGFADMVVNKVPLSVPGASALSITKLVHWTQWPVSLDSMSSGIILLALLPIVRVLLALWVYARRRDVLDTFIALSVILALLFSMWLGG
jgi:uncharacterized membrane protein